MINYYMLSQRRKSKSNWSSFVGSDLELLEVRDRFNFSELEMHAEKAWLHFEVKHATYKPIEEKLPDEIYQRFYYLDAILHTND